MCLSRISFVHSFYIISIYGFYITLDSTSFNILSSCCVPTTATELSSYQRLCAEMQIALNRTGRSARSLLRELPAKIYITIYIEYTPRQMHNIMQKTKRYRYKYLVYNSTWLGSLSWPALVSFCVATNLLHINLNLRDLNKLHRHTLHIYIMYWYII